MTDTKPIQRKNISITIAKIIFYLCAFYFLLMGLGLIFFPQYLTRGIGGGEVHPAIVGMLRGTGASIIPYVLLYVLVAIKPQQLHWALYVIFTANIIAIILDFTSVYLDEYKLSYAMYDAPMELLSLVGVFLFWRKRSI